MNAEGPGGAAKPMSTGLGAPPEVPLREGLALLWSYSQPRFGTLLFGIVLGLGTTSASLATPIVTKWVLDTLGVGGSLAAPVGVLLGLLCFGILTGFTQTVLLGRLAEGIVLSARHSLVQRFFRGRLEQVQQFRSGELITRVTSDTLLLREATTSSVVELVNGSVALIGTVVLMLWLDWQLLVITLLCLLVIGLVLLLVIPQIGKAEKQAQATLGSLGAQLESSLRALRTVKAHAAEDQEIEQTTVLSARVRRFSIRSLWFSALVGGVAGGGVQLAIILILGIGAGRVALGDIAVSTLVAFLLYAFNIVVPITSLTVAFSSVQSGLAAAARIRETDTLEVEDLDAKQEHPVQPQELEVAPRLVLHGVTAGYAGAERPALRGVDLEIPRTGHIALVGPSGAGKTTVFSLLLRFLDPLAGSLELDGVPFAALSLREVRSRIAYVEQETPVLPGSVRDNVLFRRESANLSGDDRAARDRVDEGLIWEALRHVRLEEKVASLPQQLDTEITEHTLSGGERQRIAIARALCRQADILLLDEVTAQLDGQTEAAIQSVILAASKRSVVVTIAHRLSTVIDADRIVVLEHGLVRDEGTHHELLQRDGLYQEFVHALRIQGEESPEGYRRP